MRRWVRLLPLLAAAACSGLDEGEGGVVGLEIQAPEPSPTLEVGEQVQLSARALDADGETVDAAILWRASDAALSVDATGLVTGGRSQGPATCRPPSARSPPSAIAFTVLARADTLIIVGDSVLRHPGRRPTRRSPPTWWSDWRVAPRRARSAPAR